MTSRYTMIRKSKLTVIFMIVILTMSYSRIIANNINTKLDYYEAKVEDGREPVDNLLSYYDTIIGIYANAGKHLEQIKFMIDKAEFANANGHAVKSFCIYRDVLEELSKHDDNTFVEERKKSLYAISRRALDLGMFDESAVYAFKLLEYADGKDQNYTVLGYSVLSFIFINLNKLEEAKEFNNKALCIIKTVDTLKPITFYSVYNNFAGICFTRNESDSAVWYLKEAKKYMKEIQDPNIQNVIYHNFAMVYEAIGELSAAKEYHLKTLGLMKYDEHKHITALTYYNLARLYGKMKDNEKALEYYNKALQVASRIGATKIRGNTLIAMSDLYYEKEEYKKSRDLIQAGQRALDSVFNSQNIDKISILTNNFETKNEEVEKELLKQKIAFSDLKKNVLIAILVIVIAIVIMILMKLSKQNIANRVMQRTISILKRKNRQYESKSKHNFESIIDVKNKELATTTLSLVTANQTLLDLKEQFNKLKACNKNTDKYSVLKSMETLFNSYNPEYENEEFHAYFEQVKQSFFNRLCKKHPDLSYEDQRICALLILNLSAKEIAKMTNKPIRTVETKIYHIRKTLGLQAKVKTVPYLRQFVDR